MEPTIIRLLEILNQLKSDLRDPTCTDKGREAIRKCIELVRIRILRLVEKL